MKTLAALFCMLSVTIGCLAADQPDDPRGWNKAKWGMTQAQVVAAFDGTPHMSKDDTLALAGIDRENLVLDEFVIAAMKFKVAFYFDEKGTLKEILLSPIGNQRIVPAPAYSNIRSALTDKYGSPSKTDDRKPTRSGGTESSAEWLLPSTVIHVTLLDYGSSGGYMSLAYRRREKTSDVI